MLAGEKLAEPVALDVDPFSDAVLVDPYPFFEAMRDASPVVYFPQYDLYGVGRHAEAEIVASDWERFTSIHGMAMNDLRSPDAWRTASPISESDPPDHTVIRKAMNRILSPAVLRSWKATFADVADKIIAEVTARDTLDGVKDLVEQFVLQVFPDVLGVKIPREAFLLVGEMNFNQMGPNNARTRASVDAVAPILPLYEASFQRENVVPGGFAEKIFLAEVAGNIPEGLAALLVRSFIRGGTDTSISGLGFTFNQLAQNPDEYALVRNDPTKVVAAFDEAIRHESPAQVVFRTVREDTELGGVALNADKKIAYFMGAANRDPRKFADPDSYRIGRNSVGIHLALGRGIHVCIGQMIVRLEADCLLNAFARAVKRFEPAAAPTYRPVNAMRTLDTLPLRITERA